MRTVRKVWQDKEDCESEGKIWVPPHRKEDGTLIHGYCRDR